jgi:hypothetical protein
VLTLDTGWLLLLQERVTFWWYPPDAGVASAISLLDETAAAVLVRKVEVCRHRKIQGDEVKQAFVSVRKAANEIFLEALVPSLNVC